MLNDCSNDVITFRSKCVRQRPHQQYYNHMMSTPAPGRNKFECLCWTTCLNWCNMTPVECHLSLASEMLLRSKWIQTILLEINWWEDECRETLPEPHPHDVLFVQYRQRPWAKWLCFATIHVLAASSACKKMFVTCDTVQCAIQAATMRGMTLFRYNSCVSCERYDSFVAKPTRISTSKIRGPASLRLWFK